MVSFATTTTATKGKLTKKFFWQALDILVMGGEELNYA
jgi:hypothetical protein